MTWSKADIRKARRAPLLPLLQARGHRIRPLHYDNWRVEDFGDLTVKDGYWVWPSHNRAGNAIDFFTAVEGMTFAQAMQILAD
jgi:hypothetical protein